MIEQLFIKETQDACKQIFNASVDCKDIQLQKTVKNFDGDLTIVVFPLLRYSKKKPEETAKLLGEFLQKKLNIVERFNIVKGFLNIVIADYYWLKFFNEHKNEINYGFAKQQSQENPIIIEFSSPNTNKPLHLGHIRNNVLGCAMANILKAIGKNVVRVNLVNDRGIHICKSMLAWQKWGNGATPKSKEMKGDKLVGEYYVLFEKNNQKEIQQLVDSGIKIDEAKNKTQLLKEAQLMLQKWENNDTEIHSLWEKMNLWVYDGFQKTYERMGIVFDKVYYESETYVLGKSIIEKGLKKGLLIQKEDGSIWADLKNEGLDEKLLLRADRTSVYITQDIGTAKLRQDDFKPEKLIYVVGNEQNYHFDVLKKILKKLGFKWYDVIYHLSYGMVELPFGKMKSREGTVVDADDLMEEMFQTAKKITTELGKIEGFSEKEADLLFEIIGMGALKYYILKVDPKKNMIFNPEESVDLNGNTGSFIQYTHARIQSLLRKANSVGIMFDNNFHSDIELILKEKEIIKLLYEYPDVIKLSAENYNPALIANYLYELVKDYNQFYQTIPILQENDKNKTIFRLQLSKFCGQIIKSGMDLLGIQVPDKM